ncbi:LysE family transporter [Limnohabitans sp.]|uniref:LysE family translocator n=1 Tax=Limnohabitans sp. TaxID=1907725 RepID=UPI00286F823F|nr:LysE family transporter [Limnohabitans sp.]
MFGISDEGSFVVAILIFLAIPGPGNLALLAATGKGGVRSGLAATCGVIAGDQVLLWLAVAGLSAVLINYPSLYSSVKWMGAAYLLGLGYSLFNSKPGDAPVLSMKSDHYFRQGLFITVLNPKAIVFYMAFFPLFVDPAVHQGWVTFGFMAATIAGLTFLYGLLIVVLVHYLAERVRANPMMAVMLNKAAGVLLIAFGLKLAFFK